MRAAFSSCNESSKSGDESFGSEVTYQFEMYSLHCHTRRPQHRSFLFFLRIRFHGFESTPTYVNGRDSVTQAFGSCPITYSVGDGCALQQRKHLLMTPHTSAVDGPVTSSDGIQSGLMAKFRCSCHVNTDKKRRSRRRTNESQ